jgi:nitrate reductase delta subunit
MERLLSLFAEILDYPRQSLVELTRECEERLAAYLKRQAGAPESTAPDTPPGAAAEGLREFRRFVIETPREKLEEAYTETFDLSIEHCPYVGYHLFGDGYRRSAFLQELRARYRAHGFEAGIELPDHLCVMLRFLAAAAGEERDDILHEAIQPVVEKMTATAGSAASGYNAALSALAAVLKGV